MAISKEKLETLLKGSFPDATLSVVDTIGDGDHYDVRIESALFQGKTRIEQHKMVYAALGDTMQSTLHALRLMTKAV